MKSGLVSVIMPVFNGERWLVQAIESVLAQTWKNLELIIVDDGSTDASAEIAHSYVRANVTLLRQPNQGASVARNTGLAAAKGDYIQYLDADDCLDPRKIELQIAALAGASGMLATCAWSRFTGEPGDSELAPSMLWRDMAPVDYLATAYTYDRFMPVHAWLVPRTVANRAGPWPERHARNDDAEYFSRVVLESVGIVFVADAVAYYRSGHEGLSAATGRVPLEGYLWTLERIAEHLLARENSRRTRRALATSFDLFARAVDVRFPDLAEAAEMRVRTLAGARFAPLTLRPLVRLVIRLTGRAAASRVQRLYHSAKRRRQL